MIWKEDSIVARFVDGKFETDDITLASYLVQFEECICLTPFVREVEEPPPNEHPITEPTEPEVEEPEVEEPIVEPIVEDPKVEPTELKVEEPIVEEAKTTKATKKVKK
jgi:outer membrane biosynthesis protein TonB